MRRRDQDSRKEAVRTFGRNVVVLASAGTGKTSLLVERFLNQVIEQDLPIPEIAAITFSEKAAMEMRLRIARGLQMLTCSELPPGEREEATRAWRYLRTRIGEAEIEARAKRALREFPLTVISTIHGFCARILRQQAHRLDLSPEFRVDEGFGYEELKRNLWQEFLEGPQGPDGERSEIWLHALERLDLVELRHLAFRLAEFVPLLSPRRSDLPDAREIFGPRVQATLDGIEESLARGVPTEKGLGSYLQAAKCVLEAFVQGGPDAGRTAIERNPYVARGGNEQPVLVDHPPRDKKYPEATSHAEEAWRLFRVWEQLDDEAIARGLEVAASFAHEARARAIREGRLPFDALLSLTRDLLAREPRVRREIGQRFRTLLVDEFQDTNPLQYEIVFFLAEEPKSTPRNDAFQTELAAGKLFIVGDPKQSIYGFRDADIAACQRAIRHVEETGGLRLPLTTTWRAVPEIVEPLDRLFRRVFHLEPDQDPGLHPSYDGMDSGRERARDGRRVQVWTVRPEGEEKVSADEARQSEANAIAGWITDEWIGNRATPERRYGDIAVLFRASTQMHLYGQALRRWGIPFVLERARNLLDHPEAQQFWAAMRALANPTDGPAVLGVLRSVLGAVPDAELARYASEPDMSWCYTETEPDPSRFPRIARAFVWLRRWRERAERATADRLVADLLEESPLLPLHASAADGPARASTLRYIATRTASLARSEPSWPLARLLDAFETLIERGSTRLGEGNTEGTADAVQLLTFHAAKGLEFPVVVIADLARSRDGTRGRSSREADSGTLEDPPGPWLRVGRIYSSLFPWAQEHELEREQAEAKRLFYVACTRAQEHLILVHGPRSQQGGESWITLLAGWGYPTEGLEEAGPLPGEGDVEHRVVTPREPVPAAQPKPTQARSTEAIDRAERAAEGARGRLGGILRSPSGLRERPETWQEQAGEAESVRTGLTGSDSQARAVGIAVHDLLERWDFCDLEALWQSVPAAARHAARITRLEATAVEAETREVIERLLETDLPSYLASVEVLGREVPFLLDEGAERWNGTIDLIYRSRGEGLVVADYKTDREIHNEPPEDYRRQLDVYARAVARAFPDEPSPTRELLYVREGRRVRF